MKKRKILLFEYITGGGFNRTELPEALVNEGLIMLNALVELLVELDDIALVVMVDERIMTRIFLPKHVNINLIKPEHDTVLEFAELLAACDAVWPIAPESECILQNLCLEVENTGKILLNSSANAVALTGNKWHTYQHLVANGISTVETTLLNEFSYRKGEWLLKPVDGVGCSETYVLADGHDFVEHTTNLDPTRYIIQPHICGTKTSLSCLFKRGKGWLLTVNRQEFSLVNHQYQLTSLAVNIETDHARYLPIVIGIAHAIPELWGYVGVDLIEHDDQIDVLEINPRLTTSIAGIKPATGLNCAKLTLELVDGDPCVQSIYSHPISLSIHNQEQHAD